MLRSACTILHLHFLACTEFTEVGLLPIASTWQHKARKYCHFLFSNFSQSHYTSGYAASTHKIHSHSYTHTHTLRFRIKRRHFPSPKITSEFCCLFSIDHRHFCNKTRISRSYVCLPHLLRLLRLFLR